MDLREIMIDQIKTHRGITFHDFMEMALYFPELGYYSSSEEKIGKDGDFYTSPCLTPAFGAVIGKQLEEMWTILGEKQFAIVEYGAGTGILCYDILQYLQKNQRLYEQLSYCIIEKSAVMRKKQQQHLKDKVSWHNQIEDIGPISGCVLSNEVLDNFSVHQVVMDDRLMEVYVDFQKDFVERLHPGSSEIENYFDTLGVTLPKGFRAEVNLEAAAWIEKVASFLTEGFVLTIDYGYTSSELYRSSHSSGTILCYRKHELSDNPYQYIGEQDITSHINFSALCHWGSRGGLNCSGLTNQAQFLVSLGLQNELMNYAESGKSVFESAKYTAMLTRKLVLEMGPRFKVLIQQKGIRNDVAQLQGLKYTLSAA